MLPEALARLAGFVWDDFCRGLRLGCGAPRGTALVAQSPISCSRIQAGPPSKALGTGAAADADLVDERVVVFGEHIYAEGR